MINVNTSNDLINKKMINELIDKTIDEQKTINKELEDSIDKKTNEQKMVKKELEDNLMKKYETISMKKYKIKLMN